MVKSRRRRTRKRRTKQSRCQAISIDVLPDDVLLAIFDFYMDVFPLGKEQIEAWQSLVHVSWRWRSVVFGSPCHLNLRLVCTARTPVRDTLDIWPPLPLIIRDSLTESVDNIVAVLERSDRVDRIDLINVNRSRLEKLLAAIQVPFPGLTYLQLSSNDETLPVLPDSFLGGFAPRLRFLKLYKIPFPGLPKLLLSATHLGILNVSNIPHSGYISPEAMVTALSALTSLKSLALGFQFPRYHPDLAIQRAPRQTRTVLPVLTDFSFKGVCEYLDDLVARIDAPRLYELSITFFNDIVFDTSQFTQFISRTPAWKTLEYAHVYFEDGDARINFLSQAPEYRSVDVGISCRELDWQLSFLEQVCTSCLPPLQVSTSENLYIHQGPLSHPHRQDNIENTLWLELLHPFIGVKNLHLSKAFVPRIAPALQELVRSRTTELSEVLPVLQNIFLGGLQPSGSVEEGIQQFVAMRQVTSHPIAVSRWEYGLSMDN